MDDGDVDYALPVVYPAPPSWHMDTFIRYASPMVCPCDEDAGMNSVMMRFIR